MKKFKQFVESWGKGKNTGPNKVVTDKPQTVRRGKNSTPVKHPDDPNVIIGHVRKTDGMYDAIPYGKYATGIGWGTASHKDAIEQLQSHAREEDGRAKKK